jgi:DNA polymerase III alpha subunit (gram-positive type)
MKYGSSFFVLDVETGGLSSETNPMLEIAVCVVSSELEDLGSYESLITPYGNLEIKQAALDANGITYDLLKSKGKSPDVVCQELIKLFNKYKSGKSLPILVGHNIDKFDLDFLISFFKFNKQDLSKYINNDVTIDTLIWSRLRWTESVNYKLHTCCQNAGIELVNAHRAMVDTVSTKELFKYFMKGLRCSGNELEVKENRYRATFEF